MSETQAPARTTMDEDVQQFRQSLLAEIDVEAVTAGDYRRTRFVDRACQILQESEELEDFAVCHVDAEWKPNRARVLADAYHFSEADGILSLVVADFDGSAEPSALMTEDVRRLVAAAVRFLEGSVYGDVANCWDESNPAHQLARRIFEFATEEITKARVLLLTDRPITLHLGRMPEHKLGVSDVDIQIWGIDRLFRADAATTGRGELFIDFGERDGRGIPALPAALEGSDYRSYMCVVPGDVLAGLYDRFGGRILEQNVRAFLGEGRKVNRGIRETLRERPDMFFAYNNGVTATASSVQADESGGFITSVRDFQIVNGGQTTASLYWARRSGVDLGRVFVQMKLSVLPEDGFEDAVHAIARFANAQNAVSASDLFAGHPFFKRLEKLSRQVLAPPAGKAIQNTYWFFERAQGSYNLELRRQRGIAAKFWQLLNPKSQKLGKTDVARYEVTWARQPHSVSQGAQKNITAFGRIISEQWDRDPEVFDDRFFRRLVGKCLLIRAVDKAIPMQPWYPGSVLRQLTSYAVALLSERMAEEGVEPDFEAIWKTQAAPAWFVDEAMRIAAPVLELLTNIPLQYTRNRLVTEWAKRQDCWETVRASDIRLSGAFVQRLVRTQGGPARPDPWHVRSRQMWRDGTFKRLAAWVHQAELELSERERELIERTAIASEFGLKGWRLKKLEDAWKKAVDAGFA